jgi:hypothetical protein
MQSKGASQLGRLVSGVEVSGRLLALDGLPEDHVADAT